MKIVFMGTPAFAVPSLKALVAAGHQVVGVFCQPDRPKGRSKKPAPCPVKEAALELNIPVIQPKRVKRKQWVAELENLAPDLIVVAAYGQLLSQKILDIPHVACVNVHASLLPRWRGASPIHFSILEGDAETGVCIMKMELELDAGPVYSRAALPIERHEPRSHLETRLAETGAVLLCETIPKLAGIVPEPQDPTGVTYAPIIDKSMAYCRFDQPAIHLERHVNAFEGWPGSQCMFHGQVVKLTRVESDESNHSAKPGEVLEVTRKSLRIACAENTVLKILEIQPAGKKSQPIAAFNNGYRPEPGEMFQTLTT